MSARRRRKRARVEPTHEWERSVPLLWWPEQEEYEKIRKPGLEDLEVKETLYKVRSP